MVARRLRRLALGLVPALGMIATISLPVHAVAPVPNAYLAFNEYPAALSSQPYEIISGPDGNVWYTAHNKDRVVVLRPADGTVLHSYSLSTIAPGCGPTGITIGPDRSVWISCYGADALVRITPSNGAQKVYALPKSTTGGCVCPFFLTPGPDGYLWFDEAGPGDVARLSVTTGSVHRYPLAAASNVGPRGITVGPDGNIWFAETFINRIGRLTTSGTLTTFGVPTANSAPWGITPGPDGNLFYTEVNGNRIGRIAMTGVTTEFAIPTALSGPRLINVGPDGNLWFAEYDKAKIGSMTPAGVFHEVLVPTPNSQPNDVASGPDGNLWFTEAAGNKIGKVGTRHSALTLDKTAIGFGDVAVGTTTAAQRITLTNNGPDALPAFTPNLAGSGAGGTAGNFSGSTQTCSAGDIAPAASCYEDINFTANAPGSASGLLDFKTDRAAPYQQTLSAGLSANVNAASCTSAAIGTDFPSPQNVGATVTLSATSTCPDASPDYQFYLRVPVKGWVVIQPFSPSPSFMWDTSTYAPGTYLIGIWVRDALSTKAYDAYAFSTFTLELPGCTSTTVDSGTPASPQAAGTAISFQATPGSDCPNPLFQWWLRDTAGVWGIVPGYDFAHSSATFAWNTNGLATGTYQVGVWAKETGSSKSYDAYSFITYTLAVLPITGTTQCKAVTVAPDLTSPQTVGTSVTFTANPVLGCDTPQFKWWVRNTAGIWMMVKDYPGASTYVWPTASLPAGTYQIGVWVRQTGSSASYEAYSFVTYTLTIPPASQPCTSVGIAPDPLTPSPQASGTTINFTASALGCGSAAEYEFWVQPPGGAWTPVQPYPALNPYAWHTGGLSDGEYQIGVWARQSGSTAAYEAYAFITFQLQSNGIPCSTLSMFPTNRSLVNDTSSQSPQPAGTVVVWNALALGCPQPEYQFTVQGPGSYSRIFRFYGPAATASWNTAGLPRGTYTIEVLARVVGSVAPYDVVAVSSYEVV